MSITILKNHRNKAFIILGNINARNTITNIIHKNSHNFKRHNTTPWSLLSNKYRPRISTFIQLLSTIAKALNLPANIYLFNVNHRNTKERFEICLKLTIKHQGKVIEAIFVFLLLTVNMFHTFFWCFYS